MNLLLVDAGNARLKWVRYDAGRLGATHVAEFNRNPDKAVAELCESVPDDVDAIAISNVAGRGFADRLKQSLANGPHRLVWYASTTREADGVRNGYVQPEQLGVDRWAALVGAFARLRAGGTAAPLCVVDAGTALTIDALKNDGTHLGGLILPGLALQRTALFTATADIAPDTRAVADPLAGTTLFATSTAEAIARSGAVACAAATDRCVQELAAAIQRPGVMLTGGDASALAPWLACGYEICPNLVFEGLAILFEQRSSD